jgi:hypothetical protein
MERLPTPGRTPVVPQPQSPLQSREQPVLQNSLLSLDFRANEVQERLLLPAQVLGWGL